MLQSNDVCQDKVTSSSSSSRRDGHDSDCEFPVAWRADWYQSGLGEVTISATEINHKGTCFDHHGDFYVVENRLLTDVCVCVKHDNITSHRYFQFAWNICPWCVLRDSRLYAWSSQFRLTRHTFAGTRFRHGIIKADFIYIMSNGQVCMIDERFIPVSNIGCSNVTMRGTRHVCHVQFAQETSDILNLSLH